MCEVQERNDCERICVISGTHTNKKIHNKNTLKWLSVLGEKERVGPKRDKYTRELIRNQDNNGS